MERSFSDQRGYTESPIAYTRTLVKLLILKAVKLSILPILPLGIMAKNTS
ncbi:hypothetical protein VCHA48O428_50029 [Vibrio chagasii]|nr:hypothetical protein VCHA48O428_50029 [Vibrio chagasii]